MERSRRIQVLAIVFLSIFFVGGFKLLTYAIYIVSNANVSSEKEAAAVMTNSILASIFGFGLLGASVGILADALAHHTKLYWAVIVLVVPFLIFLLGPFGEESFRSRLFAHSEFSFYWHVAFLVYFIGLVIAACLCVAGVLISYRRR